MYSVIDIESNGAPFRKESIIEIAIYRFDGHEITDQFISLVNPEDEISSFVQKLTGITQKMVITAPKFHEIAKRIVEITQDSILVGHNIDFDYRMLRQSFKRLGYEFKIKTLDTIPLAQKLIPEEKSYSLSKLCKSIGIPLSEAHRASGDARATLDLFKLLIIKDKNNEIIQSQQEESLEKDYISKVQILTEDLPNERGILYFQNSDGKSSVLMLLKTFISLPRKFSIPIKRNIKKSRKRLRKSLMNLPARI
jgi:DNA polymerase-3 subunit epsilon